MLQKVTKYPHILFLALLIFIFPCAQKKGGKRNPSIKVILLQPKSSIYGKLLIGTGETTRSGIDCLCFGLSLFLIPVGIKCLEPQHHSAARKVSKRMKSSRVIYFFQRPEKAEKQVTHSGIVTGGYKLIFDLFFFTSLEYLRITLSNNYCGESLLLEGGLDLNPISFI